MIEYNNSAGRILDIIQKFGPLSGRNLKLNNIAEIFGVTSNWSAILIAIRDLQDEYELLCNEIEQVKDDPAKYSLYKKNLPDIKKSITSFNINLAAGSCQCSIVDTSITALQFIAVNFPQDEAANENDIQSIRDLVNELQQEIENSDVFSKSVREWLLDLVRVIRDSIDRFQIRGSRGMSKQLSLLVGELFSHYDIIKEVQEKGPDIWKQLTFGINLMNKLATLAKHAHTAVSFA